jgi:Leucine-rich repeat (LRR) protein
VSLNSLNVERNAMSGRLTKSIGKASNLGHLNLRSNQFASELPMELFDLQKMVHLDIGDNEFSGTLPDEISKLNALEALRFGPNLFTGTIPSTIGLLGQLKYLSVSGIAGLTGRIPAEFGFQLDSLEKLSISETSVSGNIDTSFGKLPNLISLNFSNNQLRSVIPSELGNLANLGTSHQRKRRRKLLKIRSCSY